MGTKELSVVGIQKFQQSLSGAEPTIDDGNGVKTLDRVVDTDTRNVWLAMENTAPNWVRGANYSKKFGEPPPASYNSQLIRADDSFPKQVMTSTAAPARVSHVRIYCHSPFDSSGVTYSLGDADDVDGYMTFQAPTSVGWVNSGFTLGPYLLQGGKASIGTDLPQVNIRRSSASTRGAMTIFVFWDKVGSPTSADHRYVASDAGNRYDTVPGADSSGTGLITIIGGCYYAAANQNHIIRTSLGYSIYDTGLYAGYLWNGGVGYGGMTSVIAKSTWFMHWGNKLYRRDLITLGSAASDLAFSSTRYYRGSCRNDFEVFIMGGSPYQYTDYNAVASIDVVNATTNSVTVSDSDSLGYASALGCVASNKQYAAYVPFPLTGTSGYGGLWKTSSLIPGVMNWTSVESIRSGGGLALANDLMGVFYGYLSQSGTNYAGNTLYKLDFTTSTLLALNKGTTGSGGWGTAAGCDGLTGYMLVQASPVSTAPYPSIFNNPESYARPGFSNMMTINMTLGTTTVSPSLSNAKVFATGASGG